jgi:hypothetical protein
VQNYFVQTIGFREKGINTNVTTLKQIFRRQKERVVHHWRGIIIFSSSVKGTVSQDFLLQVFPESTSPKPLKITLGSFRIFLKIRGDTPM